jgi:hypothetical protein
MDDLISRQAAIDAICKEGTRLERNGTVAMCEIKQWCIDLLERLPSAQPEVLACGSGELDAQPEIVRCKDCKWYGRVDKRRFYRGMDCLQKHIDTIVPDRDFCSKAERRGEQDEKRI